MLRAEDSNTKKAKRKMDSEDGMTEGMPAGMPEAGSTDDNASIESAATPAEQGGRTELPAVARPEEPGAGKSPEQVVAALAGLVGPLAAFAASIGEIVRAFSRPPGADGPGVEAGPIGQGNARESGEDAVRERDRSVARRDAAPASAGQETPASAGGARPLDTPGLGDTEAGGGADDNDNGGNNDSPRPGASPGLGDLAESQRQTEAALAAAAQRAAQQARSAEALAALLDQLAESDARLEAKIDQLASQVANRR
jgi:hypothetical protein